MISNIGAAELAIIALLMLFLFGGKKLPQLSRGIADSVREFKKAANETAE